MFEPAEAGRAAGTHGDSMNGEFAVAREKRRRKIFQSYTRSSGDDYYIRIRVQAVQDGVVFIRDQRGEIDKTSVAFNEGREHWSIGVRNAMPMRPRTGRQQFIPGDHQADSRPAIDMHLFNTDGTQHSKVLRPQQSSMRQECRPLSNVLSPAADMFTRRDCSECDDRLRAIALALRVGLAFAPLISRCRFCAVDPL